MKNVVFFLIFYFITISVLSQCSINQYIQDNYELDAKILVMRDIKENPQDPDYDNPFLPDSRVVPYLEKLSAIYENSINSPIIDEIFNDFNIHVNHEYNYQVDYKNIVLRVSTSLPWLDGFINTGNSGINELDNLLSTYQLSLTNHYQLNSCSCTILYLETNFEFLNMYALIDDFESINDIDYAEVFLNDISSRFNYSGIPHIIYEPFDSSSFVYVEVCDIFINDEDEFVFGLYGGDCMAGCGLSEFRYVTVTDNCEVIDARLSVDKTEIQQFNVYPNPAVNEVFIESKNPNNIKVEIYTMLGKKVLSTKLTNNTLNVSSLNSGIYIVKIQQNNNSVSKRIIIK